MAKLTKKDKEFLKKIGYLEATPGCGIYAIR